MAVPLYTPRVNNNDDTVRLTHLFVEPGAHVNSGDPVADVETDKATFTVEAEQEGFVLGFNAAKGETIAVGSVLAWIGATADEALPQASSASAQPVGTNGTHVHDGSLESGVTLKAAILLAQHGLEAAQVPAAAGKLTAGDVERYVTAQGVKSAAPGNVKAAPPVAVVLPEGRASELSPEERGMLRTVEWHHREAVAAYVEIGYHESAWNEYSAVFQKQHRLLISPLLSLMAWRLVRIAVDKPALNATINGGSKYVYEHVNLGFTVQAGPRLYVAVIHEAEKLDEAEFVSRLSELQRRALKNTLRPNETADATICFSSMSRWPVSRHMPILTPYTALMVAHTAPAGGSAHLGATYDHRILTGAAVTQALLALARPVDP